MKICRKKERKDSCGVTDKTLLHTVCLAISAIFILIMLAACAGGSIDPAVGTDSDITGTDASAEGSGDVITSDTSEPDEPDVPPAEEVALEGDFVILVSGNWVANDFAASKNVPDTVNKAVAERNKHLLDTYGIKITAKDITAADSAKGSGAGYDELYKQYLADASDYDAAMIGAQDALSAGYKGYLHDLGDISTLDLTSEYWDQGILTDLETFGANYFATGDISYIDEASWRVLFFSKTAADTAGITSPYELVKQDKWNFDTYYELIKSMAKDIDNDGRYSAKTDSVGLLVDNATVLSMLNAAGERVGGFVDGTLTLTFMNDRVKAMLGNYCSIVQTPGYALNYERDSTYSSGDVNKMLKSGRALFYSRTVLNYRSVKNGGVDYGVVPYPKYDEAQDDYYTRVDGYACQYLCMPETVESLSRSGKIVGMLAELGNGIKEAYRTDIATSASRAVDEDALEMLELISGSTLYDIGAIKNPASVATLIQRLVYNGSTVEAVYKEKGEVANVLLDSMGQLYEEHVGVGRDKSFLRNFERHAEWYNEITEQGIEQNRKGDAVFTVVDKNGDPIKDAKVTVVQNDHEFLFGANIFMLDEMETAEKNELYKEYFKNTFNLATLPFYWNANEPTRGKTRYEIGSSDMYRRPPIDLCLEFCLENGIQPREHGLAYAYFFPNWYKNLTDKNQQYTLLEKRMEEIAKLYADVIPTIEVTNETYRSNSVVEIYNDSSYVEWSFKTAQKYFTDNKLAINEGDHVWEVPTTKARYYRQIRDTLASGGRIDAIGIQYHILDSEHDNAWASSDIFYNPKVIWETLELFASFDLPIQITEITIPAYSNDPEAEKLQAELLEKVYTLWFAHPNVEQIVYWNVVDGYAHGTTPGDMSAGENQYYGGLLRFDMTPKPAYETLKKLLDETWHTEERLSTDASGNASVRGFYGEYTVSVEISGTVITQTVEISKGAENKFIIEVK